jgi:large subunit ribosomal protein L6
MSRVGRSPVEISNNVQVSINDGNHIVVKGPKGTLDRVFPEVIRFSQEGDQILLSRSSDVAEHRSLHGLCRALLNNMVIGVLEGFTRTLEIQGVGYRVQLQGTTLQFNVGFSHPVTVTAPDGITFEVNGSRINVSGIDKEQVGQVASDIRRIRPPEPYKGKGIRYLGEYVRRKAGKAGKVGM